MEEITIDRLEGEFEFLPTPAAGFDAGPAVNGFSRNRSVESTLFPIAIVSIIVIIALIWCCKWSAEDRYRPNRRTDLEEACQAVKAEGANGLVAERIFEPTSVRRMSKGNERVCALKAPACACVGGNRNGQPPRQKGWRRNPDTDLYSYAPATV